MTLSSPGIPTEADVRSSRTFGRQTVAETMPGERAALRAEALRTGTQLRLARTRRRGQSEAWDYSSIAVRPTCLDSSKRFTGGSTTATFRRREPVRIR